MRKQERKSVVIRIVDQTNEPVANALISMLDGTEVFPEITLKSDDSGKVKISLPIGSYRLSAIKAELSGDVIIQVNDSDSGSASDVLLRIRESS